MNDADLEKLTIEPGKLSPAFHRTITKYDIILESATKEITINPITSDINSSWTIVGYGTMRQIPLTDGEKRDLVIEVTAEDGTEKQYTVNISVLSASDASLSGIKLSNGSLSPTFKHDVLEYCVNLPWNLESVKILPEAIDRDVQGANEYLEVPLNYGETLKIIEILSPNKTFCKRYVINFIKDRILRLLIPVCDEGMLCCPICLGEVHCAVSIKQEASFSSKKVVSCKACMDMITRTRKINPFTDLPLSPSFIVNEQDIDTELSSLRVFCCYKGSGCEMTMALSKLGSHMSICGFKPILAQRYEGVITQNYVDEVEKVSVVVCDICSRSICKDDMSTHVESYCPGKRNDVKFEHAVKLRDWEKSFQRKCEVVSTTNDIEVTEKDDPMQLDIAAARYAGMINMKPHDALNHFSLGAVFEEMFYVQDVWGVKKMEAEKEDDGRECEDLMDIEIRAICKAKGVNENAELPLILKALDEEYRELLLENKSAKADYLQNLYAWKSKQSVKKRKTSFIEAVDETLERSLLKYLDASCCDPNNSTYHMHVGRLLLMQHKYEDAIKRLEAAVGLKPTSIEAKFYLGLAYAKHFPSQECSRYPSEKYLQDGVDFILYKLFEDAALQSQLSFCSAKIFVRHSNVLLMEGMLELANSLKEKGFSAEKERERIIGMYHQTSKLCIQILSGIKHKNKIYKQLQWIALRAQLSLGLIKSKIAKSAKEKMNVVKYWERLAALSKAFELPSTESFLQMQRDIWEEVVVLSPLNSQALYHLGDAQLAVYDNFLEENHCKDDNVNNYMLYLDDAKKSYRASIQLEGKPLNRNEHCLLINDSIWWKKRHRNLRKGSAIPQPKGETMPKSKQNENFKISTNKASPVVIRGQVKARQPIQTKTSATSVSKRGAENSQNGKIVAANSKDRKVVAANAKSLKMSESRIPIINAGKKLTKLESKQHTGCAAGRKGSKDKEVTLHATNEKEASEQGEKEVKSQMNKECLQGEKEVKSQMNKECLQNDIRKKNEETEVILNAVSYQARIGLARALSRSEKNDNLSEMKELYEEVIKLAPDVHDAYIELGELFSQTEPKKAIEIYSKYPFKKEGNFDDAYLYEEIIRLILKTEDFNNSCLQSCMVGYGKVMGLSALDKTVTILEEKLKFDILMNVYAEVNNKDISDSDLQSFFKFKCWV